MTQIGSRHRRGSMLLPDSKFFRTPKIAQIWLWLASVLFLAAMCSSQAQVDIFMSVGGQPAAITVNPQNQPTLKGDSVDTEYPGWIKLSSAQLGVGRGISLSGSTVSASNPSVSEVVVTKLTDSSTPSLYTLTCGGTAAVTQPINYVTIDFRKSGTTEAFYRLTLQNVYFSGVSTSGGGDIPQESLSIFFTRVSWTYVSFDQYGKAQPPVTKGWDVIKNAGF